MSIIDGSVSSPDEGSQCPGSNVGPYPGSFQPGYPHALGAQSTAPAVQHSSVAALDPSFIPLPTSIDLPSVNLPSLLAPNPFVELPSVKFPLI
jgi:hypothetical protein